jgi:hypothetical protein
VHVRIGGVGEDFFLEQQERIDETGTVVANKRERMMDAAFNDPAARVSICASGRLSLFFLCERCCHWGAQPQLTGTESTGAGSQGRHECLCVRAERFALFGLWSHVLAFAVDPIHPSALRFVEESRARRMGRRERRCGGADGAGN